MNTNYLLIIFYCLFFCNCSLSSLGKYNPGDGESDSSVEDDEGQEILHDGIDDISTDDEGVVDITEILDPMELNDIHHDPDDAVEDEASVFECTDSSACDDGNLCNGEETCNLETHTCKPGDDRPDGTQCGSSPRMICLSGVCTESLCGDGFVDFGGVEECESGEEVACMTGCGTSGTGFCTEDCEIPTGWRCHDGTAEVCNGIDDNCNGQLDEDFECAMYAVVTCTSSCSGQGDGICSGDCTLPSACFVDEICGNGIDDDCDTIRDERPCVDEDEWVCHNVTLDDLGLTCETPELGCLNDTDFTCETAYSNAAEGCSGNCLYLKSYRIDTSGYCGYLWISKKFVVPAGFPVLNFSFKSTGVSSAGQRGVALEIAGRPETFARIVEHNGADDTSWTPHSVDLSGFEGATVKIIFYMKDLSGWCDTSFHRVWAYAKDFVFAAP